MNSSAAVTLQQITREAGVSSRTVSRVLSGETKGVRPSAAELVERIRRLAAGRGYLPNTAAKAVKAGRFDSIGLLTKRIDEPDTILPPLALPFEFRAGSTLGAVRRESRTLQGRATSRGMVPTGKQRQAKG